MPRKAQQQVKAQPQQQCHLPISSHSLLRTIRNSNSGSGSKSPHYESTGATATASGSLSPPAPSSDDTTVPNGHCQWKRLQETDWDTHRARITELYCDSGMHLHQVIDTMARECAFYASPRMYKSRISKWAIGKKYKTADVAYMLALKRQRATSGKASSFVLRGRRVDWTKVEQHTKRNPELLRRLEASDDLTDLLSGHTNASGIICRTPWPSPPSASPQIGPAQPTPSQPSQPLQQSTRRDCMLSPSISRRPRQPLVVNNNSSNAPRHCQMLLTAKNPAHRHSLATSTTSTDEDQPLSAGRVFLSMSPGGRWPVTPGQSDRSVAIRHGNGHRIDTLATMIDTANTMAISQDFPPSPHPWTYNYKPTLRIMPPPSETGLSDELLSLAHHYCLGALGQGLWVPGPSGSYTSSRTGLPDTVHLQVWGQKMSMARRLIGTGDLDNGFRHMGTCLDELRLHIWNEDPALLFHLLSNTVGHTPKLRTLAVSLCRYVRHLVHIVLGSNHPISLIFDRIDAVVTSDAHFEVLSLPLKCLIDIFRQHDTGVVDPRLGPLCDRFAQLLRRGSSDSDNTIENCGTAASQPAMFVAKSKRASVVADHNTASSLKSHTFIASPRAVSASSVPLMLQQPPHQLSQCTGSSSSRHDSRLSSQNAASDIPGAARPLPFFPPSSIATIDPQDSADLQQLTNIFEQSCDIHTRLRFYYTYLSYLSELAIMTNRPLLVRC